MKEIFKEIPGYEGIYEVSNLGNIKSFKFGKEKLLRPRLGQAICYSIVLSKNGKLKAFKIHQLVAMAFLNHKPDGTQKIVVDHIDSNPLNNRLCNLRLITNRENCSKERTHKSGLPVGVSFHKSTNKYQSKIFYNGKQKYLGLFNTIEDASKAYQNKLNSIKNA
jgi:hypothetical protein